MKSIDTTPLLGSGPAGQIAAQARRGRKRTPDQPNGMTSRVHSEKTEADRMAEEDAVLDRKIKGMSDRAIAAELGVTHTTVQNRLKAALSRVSAPKVDEVRTIITEQLDVMLERLSTGIQAGDPKAINTALGILDRKAKVYGIDAPTKVDVTVETEADREIKNLMALIADASADARDMLAAEVD